VREPSVRTALQTRRYLGLELAGAKSDRTAIAAIEYYPKERKIFLLDLFDRQGTTDTQSADEALLQLLQELTPEIQAVGAHVPLTLPPCIECTRKHCPLPARCTVPAVKWMREQSKVGSVARKNAKTRRRQLELTPYTQRPIELFIRQKILAEVPEDRRIEVDDALGSTRAPLTARMHFLRRHLPDVPFIEVSPKLSLVLLASELGIQKRLLRSHRHLEEGAQARTQILELLAQAHGVFFYDRDLRKLALNLAAFDAFFSAYTALLAFEGQGAQPPRGFPNASGWIAHPAPREKSERGGDRK
jgi:hypothetical protein